MVILSDCASMQRINTLVEKRIKVALDIHKDIYEYFGLIESMLNKQSTGNAAKLFDIRESLPKDAKTAREILSSLQTKNAVEDLIATISELYIMLETLDVKMHTAINIISDPLYIKLLTVNMSHTFNNNMTSFRKNLIEMITAFEKKIINEDGEEVLSDIYTLINPVEHLSVFSTWIENNTLITQFVIYMVKRLVSEIPSDGPRKGYAIKMVNKIEKLKDITLCNNDNPYINLTLDNITQNLTSRHGLVPISKYFVAEEAEKSLCEVIDSFLTEKEPDFIHKETAGGTLENILAARYNAKVVHVPKFSNKLIEFNILPLVDGNYVKKNNLETAAASGLNNKIINRFSTVKKIDLKNTEVVANTVNPLFFGEDTATRGLVIQSVNGEHFRLMSINIQHVFTPLEVIDHIRKGLHLRSHYYNKIMENEILGKALDAKHRAILNKFESSTLANVASDGIKRKLIDMCIDSVSNELTTFLKYKVTVRDIQHLFTSEAMLNQIQKNVNKVFVESIDPPQVSLGDDELEVGLSYISNLNFIMAKTVKEYLSNCNSLFASNKITQATIRETKDMYGYLLGWYRDLITNTVEILDAKPMSINEMETTLKKVLLNRNY